MKEKKTWQKFLLWTWCLPQTILGLLVFIITLEQNVEIRHYKSVNLNKLDWDGFGGLSLGKYIFLESKKFDQKHIRHEYGHTIQNYILGPLYLLVVGIPSLTLSTLARFSDTVKRNYFNCFPENWADSLGKVKEEK